MTDDKIRTGTSTSVTEIQTGSEGFDALTPEEEKALRMLHGLSEDDNHMLKFGLGADSDTKLKLAMMEKFLIDAFQRAPAPELDLDDHHIEAKAKIIDKLRDS